MIALIGSITESFTNNLIAEDRYRMILDGLQVTLLITLCAALLGTLLGGLVCWMRMSRSKWLQQVAKVYIELMRGTPVLVLLMLMYYVVMAPLDATGIVVAIITFGMNTAAYISEMLRTSIEGVNHGQTEAGLALGFTPRQTFFRIVLPQVVKSVMPVYQGEIISLLKGTSIVGYIAVMDMTRASDLIRSRTFDAFFPLIVTAIIYFVVAWLIGLLLTSLVQHKYKKAGLTAVVLLFFGLVGYLPPMLQSEKPAAVTETKEEVPPAFRALSGKRVGTVIGSIQDIAVTSLVPDADIHRYSTLTDMLAALDNGKVDVALDENLTLMFNKEIAAKVDSMDAGQTPTPIAACFRPDNTELQQDFNSFLAEIRADGTYQTILDRWSKAENPSEMAVPKQTGQGRTLCVATFNSMPPYSFISHGKPSGLEPELITEWANRRNWRLKFLIMDFASQLPAVQTGKAEMAMGAISITEERKKQVLFSDGYIESRTILITRKGELSILTGEVKEDESEDFDDWWMIIAAFLAALAIGGGLYAWKKHSDRRPMVQADAETKSDAPIISVSHMKKCFGSLEVLRDVTVDIHRGDVISIIGPSGTGKSTFLRALNLLDPPTDGAILVDGENIMDKGYPKHQLRQKMGMVFQSFNLFEHMTVLQNVMYAPVEILKENPEQAREEALALLKKVGLVEKADVYPSSLSGGQKQRVAIARSLAMHPEVILFDEPTSALDPTMVGEVLSVIRQLAKSGLTMLIVTHEMKFAHDVSTRIFFMNEGIVYEDGTPEQIFDHPVRSATKAFVQRIQKLIFEIDSDDFDYLQIHTGLNRFWMKYNIRSDKELAYSLIKEVLFTHMPDIRPLTFRVTHSELAGETALDFMVEGLDHSPLNDAARKSLRPQVKELIEENTTRGFRIKLILK